MQSDRFAKPCFVVGAPQSSVIQSDNRSTTPPHVLSMATGCTKDMSYSVLAVLVILGTLNSIKDQSNTICVINVMCSTRFAENTMSKSKTVLEMTAAGLDTRWYNDVTDAQQLQ